MVPKCTWLSRKQRIPSARKFKNGHQMTAIEPKSIEAAVTDCCKDQYRIKSEHGATVAFLEGSEIPNDRGGYRSCSF